MIDFERYANEHFARESLMERVKARSPPRQPRGARAILRQTFAKAKERLKNRC